MKLAGTPLSPATSDYAFQPSTDMDYVSLFEQCGIPLADLSTHLQADLSPVTKRPTKEWYHGTAPNDDDPAALDCDKGVDNAHHSTRKLRQASQPLSTVNIPVDPTIDGFGNDFVSDLHGQKTALKASPVSLTTQHGAGERARRGSNGPPALHQRRSSDVAPPTATVALKTLSSPNHFKSSTNTSPIVIPHHDKTIKLEAIKSRAQRSPGSDMDFYSQRQYYAGAQLSSPISMQSSPDDDDTFLYTATFSPEFSNFTTAGLSNNYMESEAMRRSFSTPFLGDRAIGAFQSMPVNGVDMTSCDPRSFNVEEIVPASNNARWATGEYLLPQRSMEQLSQSPRTMQSPMSATRPTMKRKNRPMPIATNAPRSSGLGIPHTAPMDGRFMAVGSERPPLSAKRSFEDFTELGLEHIDVPPYRHISTPISKRARSSQGFGASIPASPFVDTPLFSPVYGSSLSHTMDPEQLLLSSPPYSQGDFCSSPSYLMQQNPEDLGQMFSPNQLSNPSYSYAKHEPLSAVDFEGIWPQKLAFDRPAQIHARPVATPRTLTYSSSVPMRKTLSKPRRSSTVKAISFCNYTAADKKTILSGVAPSGSNKKALTKAQEMSRSQSSSAIAV